LEQTVLMGFYDAVIELGQRCLSLLRWEERPEDCWLVVAKMSTALTALDRADEAAALYDEACARSTLPSVHLQAAYGRAMLYTRFYDDQRLDHQRAKAHINTAIAISSLLPAGERRAFNLTFNENGLALIEMHLGDSEEALRLVCAGLDRLDEELGPDEQTLHRSVLRYNRAQLLTRLGPPAAALEAYDVLIASDPHHSEYYFERAAIHRRVGDVAAAAADYEAAIRLSPPYPEPHYNLADLVLDDGDTEAALRHLDRVIELEPDFVDAYVARAGVHQELGRLDLASADVAAGLALVPHHAPLLCLAGVLALDEGDVTAARARLDAAIEAEPTLTAAWANRAVLAYQSGDPQAAEADLSAALALDDRADLRINRAITYESLDRFADALADYDRALRDEEVDREAAVAGRKRCLQMLAASDSAA
jgi:tetratricopeptide (TPR) repeat protein